MTTAMTIRSGPWDAATIADFCRSVTIPIRLATVGGDGAPLVQSLWFVADVGGSDGDRIWCATQADAVVSSRIRQDPRVAFEIGADTMPYRGVRGTGTAHIDPEHGLPVLRRLLARYDIDTGTGLGAWLLSRAATEVAIEITDLEVSTWDYAGRMDDA
ncbi:MAG: pyridoxamine 5'-phosphate oxidase family protein [Acidimicrobiales bacterium]